MPFLRSDPGPDGIAWTTVEHEEVLRRAALFDSVAPGDVDALLPQFRLDGFRDSVIFRQGDPTTDGRIYVVVSGRVRTVRQVAPNRQATIALLGPTDMFGELSAFDPGPRTATARAAGEVVTASVTRTQLLEWAIERPYIVERLLRVLARRLRRTNDVSSDLIFVDVAGRVASVVLQLAQRFGTADGDAILVEHGLTQTQLAEIAGSARETVNRSLHQFADRGWIALQPEAVRILQPESLWVRAGRPPTLRPSMPVAGISARRIPLQP